jgi:hypothetical protein
VEVTAQQKNGGFTLMEMVLAIGIFSLLLIALLQLLDTSTSLWKSVDARRERTEASGGLGERIAMDLSTLESGSEGDFLADWGLIDSDGDGVPTQTVARIRFVRRASAAELARLSESRTVEFTEEELAELAALEEDGILESLADWGRMNRGLVEVTWFLCADDVPTPPGELARFHGKLLRGMRTVDDQGTLSFFDKRMFGPGGRPAAAAEFATNAVSTGVLWMGVEFATQMTLTDADFSAEGKPRAWAAGDQPTDGAMSWDAWGQRRPDADASSLNQAGASMDSPNSNNANLPRRVRVTFEVQPERDVIRRTTLRAPINHNDTEMAVADSTRLPQVGTFILIGDEWVKLLSNSGDIVRIERGQRGTMPTPHKAGLMLQFGWSMVREVPIGVFREDWDL